MFLSSTVESKKQGKNNLFLYELCLEVWTIYKGKFLFGSGGGYFS